MLSQCVCVRDPERAVGAGPVPADAGRVQDGPAIIQLIVATTGRRAHIKVVRQPAFARDWRRFEAISALIGGARLWASQRKIPIFYNENKLDD